MPDPNIDVAPFVLPRAYSRIQARGKGNVPKQEHVIAIVIVIIIIIVIVNIRIL